jgi:rod shape-determining protein MreD
MEPEWNESLLRMVGRWGLVLLVLTALFVLSAIPLEIAHLGEIRPVFMLMAIYYWTILRPSPWSPIAVFVIGLVLDLLAAYPLGMHALIFVLAQWVTGSQRKFLLGQSFLVIWAGFALIALGAGALQWVLFILFNLTLFSARLMLISTVLSVFLFPLLALLLSIVHKALADDPSSVA